MIKREQTDRKSYQSCYWHGTMGQFIAPLTRFSVWLKQLTIIFPVYFVRLCEGFLAGSTHWHAAEPAQAITAGNLIAAE